MRLLCVLLLNVSLFAQANGKNYAISSNGRSYNATAVDASSFSANSSSFYTNSVTISSGVRNPFLLYLSYQQDTGANSILNISGCGGVWASFGTAQNGTSNIKNAQAWYSIPTVTGSCTLTITETGAPSVNAGGIVYAMHNVNPWTPLAGFTSRSTAGSLVLTTARGDSGISVDYDLNSNRTISGCTSTTNPTSSFTQLGFAGATCNSTTSATFTWSGFFAGGSIATGIVVKQQ